MRGTRIAVAAILLSSLITGIAQAGGEATVTILKAPKDAVVGTPFEVAFVVRPHWPMAKSRSLEPTVKAVCGDRVVTLQAVRLEAEGQYRAAVALPAPGEWVISVDSRFCHTTMKPLVLKVGAAKGTRT